MVTRRVLGSEALTPVFVRSLVVNGLMLVDIRESPDFGAAHVPGSINIQYSSKPFGERVALLIPTTMPIVLLGDDDAQARAACSALVESGQANVVGYLAGGITAWAGAGMPVATLAQMSIHELRARLDAGDHALMLVDVREPFEWVELGYIETAIFMPMSQIEGRRHELPEGRRLALICERGLRSSTAASILLRHDLARLVNVAEGMAGWRNAGYPVLDWGGRPEPDRPADGCRAG